MINQIFGSDSGFLMNMNPFNKNRHIFIPPVVDEENGKKYKIVGISEECQRRDMCDTITFDELSEITELTTKIFLCCRYEFHLPPKIKRIKASLGVVKLRSAIINCKDNQFVTVIKNRNILNLHPLEIVFQEQKHPIISIRETVRIIGFNFNQSNKKLKSVFLPPSVEVIDKFAFSDCKNLKIVRINGKSRLRKIGDSAFEKTALISFDFPPSIEEICKNAFIQCCNLRSIKFNLTVIKSNNNKVLTIGESAFHHCRCLSSLSIDKNIRLQSIGDSAFSDTNIRSIEFPKSVEIIGKSAFKECKSLSSVSFIEDYNTNISSIEIPSIIESIEDEAFACCFKLSSVSFPKDSNLQLIGKLAFSQTRIEYIEIPSHVSKIDKEAFKGCGYLTSVTFPEDSNIKLIGEAAFSNTYIQSIEFPSTIEYIGDYLLENEIDMILPLIISFKNYSKHIRNAKTANEAKNSDNDECESSIEIPASVHYIGKELFKGIKYLNDVKFSEGSEIKSIEPSTFVFSSIVSIEIPDSVKIIGCEAFEKCKCLATISFGKNSCLKTIWGAAFKCSSIKSIKIPPSVTEINKQAFMSCRRLKKVSFCENSQLYEIGENAFSFTEIKSIEIPTSVNEIGNDAFRCCKRLKSVSFCENSSLEKIGYHAFSFTAIETISIPGKVNKIGQFAFLSCKNLSSISFNGPLDMIKIGDKALNDCPCTQYLIK